MSTATTEAERAIAAFLARPHRLLIGGEWVAAADGATLEVTDPATGRTIAQVAAGGAAEVAAAVAAARSAFDTGPWSRVPPGERARCLWRLADAIEARAEELARLECVDTGMTLALARAAVAGAVDCLRYNAGWVGKLDGATLTPSFPDHHAFTLREPVGVAALIVPWNFPLGIAVGKIASALAAGCTVVLKPAELAPLSAIRLGELLDDCGVPPGVVNIVTGTGADAGQALLEHPGVDKISFTGSAATARRVLAAAAVDFKRVSLELGGKSPVIVLPDADLERVPRAVALGIFTNAGQVCAAGSRLLVHEAVFDDVVGQVADVAATLEVGAPLDPRTDVGPLISEAHRRRVLGYVQSGVEQGAKLVAGGAPTGTAGYFMEPTVLSDVRPEMTVAREEIFGPVICAMKVDDDLGRIAAIANDSTYGLAAYVWTRDVSAVHKLARMLKAGSVRVNGAVGIDYAVPFGGYKQSGWGRERGREGVEAFTELKAVSIRL